jgi:hypothetical protein
MDVCSCFTSIEQQTGVATGNIKQCCNEIALLGLNVTLPSDG